MLVYRIDEDDKCITHSFSGKYNTKVWLDASVLARDEDGNTYNYYLSEAGEDGVYQPDTVAITEASTGTLIVEAKALRDFSIVANIEVLGDIWQVDDTGRDSMRVVIDYANRKGLLVDYTQSWRLADNSERDTTVVDLESVLDAYTERSAVIWSAYNNWYAGDKLTPFELV